MKIVVIHGQNHLGSTYHIVEMIINKLIDNKEDVREYFLPKDGPDYCIGCYNCIKKGNEYCPHAERMIPIITDMDEADIIMMDSPCYVMGMSGQLKAFLDHLAFQWISHRPKKCMYKKVGVIVSTAAGAGSKKVTKAIKENLFYMGVPNVISYGINIAASNWGEVSEEKRKKLEDKTNIIARKIKKKCTHNKVYFNSKFMFEIMRLMQKANDYSFVDRNHWEANQWLLKARPWKN